jgi:DNA-binding HxlR family transcriptional regulator
MALLDLLGRRPTLRVLWELRSEPLTFRALAAAADTNPGSLNRRLAELREARVVASGPEGYALTGEGRSLLVLLGPLWDWSETWAGRVKTDESFEEPTADP